LAAKEKDIFGQLQLSKVANIADMKAKFGTIAVVRCFKGSIVLIGRENKDMLGLQNARNVWIRVFW
jgi:hypothetical protein